MSGLTPGISLSQNDKRAKAKYLKAHAEKTLETHRVSLGFAHETPLSDQYAKIVAANTLEWERIGRS